MRVSKLISFAAFLIISAILITHLGLTLGPNNSKSATISETGRLITAHIVSPTGRGTGVYLGGTTVLTAGHVCEGMLVQKTLIISTKNRVVTRVKQFIMSPKWPAVDLCIMVLVEEPTDLQAVAISDQSANFDDTLFLSSYSGGVGYSLRTGKQLAEETVDGPRKTLQYIYMSTIYVDPGASGGPVLNDKRELVGIMILKFGESISISGYVPLDQVKEFLASINP